MIIERKGLAVGLWDRIRGIDRDRLRLHFTLVDRAAGVATVPLICHEDTWSVLTQVRAFGLDQLPADRITRRDDRLVEVELSGATLVTILDATADYDRHSRAMKIRRLVHTPAGALQIVNRLRKQIATVLEKVGPGGDSEIPPLVLDDKVKAS